MLGLLKANGKLIIGDIAFESLEDLDKCKKEAGEYWDDEEDYIVASQLSVDFPELEFIPISYCAGLIKIGI